MALTFDVDQAHVVLLSSQHKQTNVAALPCLLFLHGLPVCTCLFRERAGGRAGGRAAPPPPLGREGGLTLVGLGRYLLAPVWYFLV